MSFKQSVKSFVAYMKQLINATDPTSMTRFLALIVTVDVVIVWNIFCLIEKKMTPIPDSVLYFAGLVITGKAVKDIWCKGKGE
jgi:hypothetical protein